MKRCNSLFSLFLKGDKMSLERNPVGSIGYMVQNLCSIYNGGVYNKEEHGELLEETINMLNDLVDKLDYSWDDDKKAPLIIDIISKYNSKDGSEMMKRSTEAWLRR
jgi:hypothetical protein